MSENFLNGISTILRVIGMVITSFLLVGFTVLLLIGDILFGMKAWETITPDQMVAIILEAVPNLGLVAIGMAVVWKRGISISNLTTGAVIAVLLGIVLGGVDALKDAYGMWASLPLPTNMFQEILGYVAVFFVFALSAFGEILALGLPEFMGNVSQHMGIGSFIGGE